MVDELGVRGMHMKFLGEENMIGFWRYKKILGVVVSWWWVGMLDVRLPLAE